MTQCRSPIAERLGGSKPLLFAVIVIGVILALISAVRFQAPELLGKHKVLTDFDAFYIAGRLGGEGRVAEAYHMTTMWSAQREMTGTNSFMPWTYPPPFTLLMQGFAALPIGMSFLLFMLSSFAFYLWVLHRIAGPWLPGVVIAVTPVIILNLRTGQNGFLIAGLIGAFLLAFRDNRRVAGIPLGLLVIKPHLAVGVGLLVLLHRRWSVLFIAATLGVILLAISTFTYGFEIWGDFRNAVGEAGGFLAKGYYPLFRMNSVYAAAYCLGAKPVVAMILQAMSAIMALVILAWAYVTGLRYDILAALTCAVSVCVSPYGYDYDLTLLGIALAFVIPDVLKNSRGRDFLSILTLSWLACGYGMAWTVGAGLGKPDTGVTLGDNNGGLSLIAPMLWGLFWLTYRVLHVLRSHQSINSEKPPSRRGARCCDRY